MMNNRAAYSHGVNPEEHSDVYYGILNALFYFRDKWDKRKEQVRKAITGVSK